MKGIVWKKKYEKQKKRSIRLRTMSIEWMVCFNLETVSNVFNLNQIEEKEKKSVYTSWHNEKRRIKILSQLLTRHKHLKVYVTRML